MKLLIIVLAILTTLTACAQGPNLYGNNFIAETVATPSPEEISNNTQFWQTDPKLVWAKLQKLSISELNIAQDNANNDTTRAWIDLAIIRQQDSLKDRQLIEDLINWRKINTDHLANQLLPSIETLEQLQQTPPPSHVSILIPLQGDTEKAGKRIRDGFLNAYYASLKTNKSTKPQISFFDTAAGIPIENVYNQALAAGSDQVIGPLTRHEVENLTKINRLPKPILTLNYTSSSVLSTTPDNMVQYGLSPTDEAVQLAAHAKAAGLTNALLIAPDDPWGQRVSETLIKAWSKTQGEITDALFFKHTDHLAQNISGILHVKTTNKKDAPQLTEERRRQDIDVVFLLASSKDARQIVPLLKYNYAGDLPIYATSAVYSGKPNPRADLDLNGVIFCDIPWILKSTSHNKTRLNAVGHDAWLLATRIQRLKVLPNFPIDGATGKLTLSPNKQIFRQLTWMKIKNGHPQPEKG